MVIISILNHKGGVGKTTTAVNLSACLALRGYKTLVVDMDGQCNATHCLLGKRIEEPTLFEAITGQADKLPIFQVVKNLYCTPSSKLMSRLDVMIGGETGREYFLSRLLEKENFDFAVIDCPPAKSQAAVNALTASNYVLIPLEGEFYAYEGLEDVNATIESVVKNTTNKTLSILGVFLTKLNPRRLLSKTVRAGAAEMHGLNLLKTEIRIDVKLAETPTVRQDIFRYDPLSNGAKDYEALTVEILERLKKNGKEWRREI